MVWIAMRLVPRRLFSGPPTLPGRGALPARLMF
jgi:hypothetical protein